MRIDQALLERLAKLSMLEIQEPQLQEHLEEILVFMDALNSLDLENTPSLQQPPTALRADTPHPQPSIAPDILSHAPNTQEGFFIVPKILG
ncbi:Asp-tRNA(Asn)/Glu-tRNA(Gln) amidotransferase subunit GatC [Helicobacter baculiformis]|uniref:Aspartyl/glutamyl-tRNA(Asn/Gln) amidotransferase subunit C n=1 Tax=Helicobacter baculiformis TaxID=427351 RepID=A0ABV7ZHB7_9HELI|nr:Asp-tRNA(Asn)/Glu-tRNA(Gln) amidotransferase subunit GatC [Helicobacter baculiformis]